MKLLDTCLALALTLAVFASAVTVLVEILHRALGQRARDVRGMLGAVFDSALVAQHKGAVPSSPEGGTP